MNKYYLILLLFNVAISFSQDYTFENKYIIDNLNLKDGGIYKKCLSRKSGCVTPICSQGEYFIENEHLTLSSEDFANDTAKIISINKTENEGNNINVKLNFISPLNEPLMVASIDGEIDDKKIYIDLNGEADFKSTNKDFLFKLFNNRDIILFKQFESGFDYELKILVGRTYQKYEKYLIYSKNDSEMVIRKLNDTKKRKKLLYKKTSYNIGYN